VIKWLRKFVHGTRYGTAEAGDDSLNQAVLIRIFAESLPDDDSAIDDLAMLEDELQQLLGYECEVDGHDIGGDDATVYVYGQCANSIFEVIKPCLASNALTKRAQVVLRFGPPGSDQKLVQLPDDR